MSGSAEPHGFSAQVFLAKNMAYQMTMRGIIMPPQDGLNTKESRRDDLEAQVGQENSWLCSVATCTGLAAGEEGASDRPAA